MRDRTKMCAVLGIGLDIPMGFPHPTYDVLMPCHTSLPILPRKVSSSVECASD